MSMAIIKNGHVLVFNFSPSRWTCFSHTHIYLFSELTNKHQIDLGASLNEHSFVALFTHTHPHTFSDYLYLLLVHFFPTALKRFFLWPFSNPCNFNIMCLCLLLTPNLTLTLASVHLYLFMCKQQQKCRVQFTLISKRRRAYIFSMKIQMF